MYPLTYHTNRLLTQTSKLFASLLFWLVVVAPLAAMPPEACQDALTLPLDHSIADYVPAQGQKHYAVEVERSGFLVIEARGSGPAALAVRFLGRDCTSTASNLPVPTIHGRHLHRVRSAGTYFVEVAAGDFGDGYRLDAWWVDDDPDHRLPSKEEMDEVDEFAGCLPTKEEMDEVDEFAGCLPTKEEMDEVDEFAGCLPTKEEMDEVDEFAGWLPTKEEMDEVDEFAGCLPTKEEMDEVDELADSGSTWQEIGGHGLLEIVRVRGGLDTRFHSLCPWSQRPGLLATFTCAPQLRLAVSGMVMLRPPADDGIRLIGLTLETAGYLAAGAVDDPVATALVFDAEGRLTDELDDDSAWLEAGEYFVEVASGAGQIHIYAELD